MMSSLEKINDTLSGLEAAGVSREIVDKLRNIGKKMINARHDLATMAKSDPRQRAALEDFLLAVKDWADEGFRPLQMADLAASAQT